MLRFTVSEKNQPELPALDLAPPVVIGSGADASIRLPASSARPAHVRIDGEQWTALADVLADGAPRKAGAIGAGVAFEIGGYRVRVAPAPAGVAPSPPQRTESLARELMRGLLGDGAAPTLTIERGPNAGTRRVLPPPESIVVIGRGDDATWPILDEDLSRRHAEIRRGWDGTWVRDLDSQNGTRVDGQRIAGAVPLRDGAHLELGNLAIVFADPAERHLRKAPDAAAAPPVVTVPDRLPSFAPVLVATVIAGLAIAGLVYLLAP